MWSRAFARLLACDRDFVRRTTILRVVLAWPPYRQRGPLIGDEFPIVESPNGAKVQKVRLREMAQALLGEEQGQSNETPAS